MVELIITEKPSAAKKIAEALADGKPTLKKRKQTSYYELTHNKQKIIVASAVGHLYGLHESKNNHWAYPVFEIEWRPSYENGKDLDYIKDYIVTLEQLSKKVKTFTIACDFDVEGEVIGLNVIRFACKKKDANRMKFSTLTKGDLVEAYEHKLKHLDWGQALAGETRHKLDWFYGINVSRALTASVKAAGSFKVMSAGRVQGPALKMLVDREREIAKFKPVPFWEISLDGKAKNKNIEAWHKDDKIFDKKKVAKIIAKVKGKRKATVASVTKTQRKQAPPTPFNLTDLQSESYSQFKITPKETLQHAQSLYLAGVTSYPRTSSQQLDPKLGFTKILKGLAKQPAYKSLTGELLKIKNLTPNNGKKTDPAHPSIYPTGSVPKGLKPRTKKIYDLIVKRFMATFGEPALRETITAQLDVNTEIFIAKGTRTIEENWHRFYQPYVRLDEKTLPKMVEKDVIDIKKIEKHDKETQPPKRFNQSSIIRELEKRNLGTKATRADILDRLFKRGYIDGVQITCTKFGIETVEILEKYVPEIIDEKLTTEFEEEMALIRAGKHKQELVLKKAEKHLKELLGNFKKKEKVIGKEILSSIKEQRIVESHLRILGKDPKTGKQVSVRIGKYGPLVQLGEKKGDEKPKFASLGKQNIDEITLKHALEMFKLPRTLGKTKEGEEILANVGRFGPYVKYGDKYVSIKEGDPMHITLDEAKKLIAAKKKLDANKEIHIFKTCKVLNGMYGPYITDGKKNAKIPKGKNPKKLTEKECLQILKDAPVRRKWPRKKK